MTGIKVGAADYGRHAKRMGAMLADQQMDPVLLRWATAVARSLDRLDTWPEKRVTITFAQRAGIVWTKGAAPLRYGGGHVDTAWDLERAVRQDVRRYAPDANGWHYDHPCDGPMIRREGTCGQRSTGSAWHTNLETGEQVRLGACARHRPWWEVVMAENRAARAERIVPVPFANVGGRLAVHMPEIDWTPVYRWGAGDEDWTWPPERVAPATRPTLELLVGEKGDLPAPKPPAQPTDPARVRTLLRGTRRPLQPVPSPPAG